jgi:hypothetical protein
MEKFEAPFLYGVTFYTNTASNYTNRRYYKYLPNQNTTTYTSIIIILLLSGDISTNPGPVKYPCGKCSKHVKRNQRGIYCEDCTYWC